MKTSNIILIIFGLILIVVLIVKDLSTEKIEEFDSKKPEYKALKINKKQKANHIILNGFRQGIEYQINKGEYLIIEVINSKYYKDSCVYNFTNDTLSINILNTETYQIGFDVPNVKITIPKLLSINVNKVYCSVVGMKLDTLQVRSINSNYIGITIKKCDIQYLNFDGQNLSIDSTNRIKHLGFKSKKVGANLNLDGAIINKIDFNADSASVRLEGKSIEKYLK